MYLRPIPTASRLKDVTLTIPVGRYGLRGPNCAGMSTLMRILATLQEPDEGSIRFGDIDVTFRNNVLEFPCIDKHFAIQSNGWFFISQNFFA